MDGGNRDARFTRVRNLIALCNMPAVDDTTRYTYVGELISIALNGSPHERDEAARYLEDRYNAIVVEPVEHEAAGLAFAALH